MKRVLYTVLPMLEGGWLLEGHGLVLPGGVTTKRFQRKHEAVALAQRWCRAWGKLRVHAQLLVYTPDGPNP